MTGSKDQKIECLPAQDIEIDQVGARIAFASRIAAAENPRRCC
jgi:hypothetical protein